jgi:hypothetical protein
MDSKSRWYYAKNGRQLGAGSRELMIAACRTGEIDASTLIWVHTQLNWIPAATTEFGHFLSQRQM